VRTAGAGSSHALRVLRCDGVPGWYLRFKRARICWQLATQHQSHWHPAACQHLDSFHRIIVCVFAAIEVIDAPLWIHLRCCDIAAVVN